jgi:hypothetical protein
VQHAGIAAYWTPAVKDLGGGFPLAPEDKVGIARGVRIVDVATVAVKKLPGVTSSVPSHVLAAWNMFSAWMGELNHERGVIIANRHQARSSGVSALDSKRYNSGGLRIPACGSRRPSRSRWCRTSRPMTTPNADAATQSSKCASVVIVGLKTSASASAGEMVEGAWLELGCVRGGEPEVVGHPDHRPLDQ